LKTDQGRQIRAYLAARLVIGLVKNLFSKGFVMDPSNGETYVLTQGKYPAAKNIYENEWKLRAVFRLDNPMSRWREAFDCLLHTLSSALKDVPSNVGRD
jgi:hypothetical protein